MSGQRMEIDQLPPKIAGLYRLRNSALRVPAFSEIYCEVHQVEATICPLLEQLHIPATGVSVRSASLREDTGTQANAGEYLSFNGLTGKQEIVQAASVIVQDHFEKNGLRGCYLIMQHTIASVFSGVALASFEKGKLELLVESFFGSCRSIVDGAVIPYTSQYAAGAWDHQPLPEEAVNIFTIHPAIFDKSNFKNVASGALLFTSVKDFPRQSRFFSATADAEIKVYARLPRQAPGNYLLQVEQFALLADTLRSEYPGGLDMEWGIDAQGNCWIFQVRDLTRPLVMPRKQRQEDASQTTTASLQGIPAAEGFASGTVVHEHSAQAVTQTGKRILLLYEATVENTARLDEYAGVISVLGGMLCHLAIVCREKMIPCIVGINQIIPEGSLVNIDGGTGRIIIESFAEAQ